MCFKIEILVKIGSGGCINNSFNIEKRKDKFIYSPIVNDNNCLLDIMYRFTNNLEMNTLKFNSELNLNDVRKKLNIKLKERIIFDDIKILNKLCKHFKINLNIYSLDNGRFIIINSIKLD